MASHQTPAEPVSGLFTPKLVTVLREGYGARELRADATAGLTVAIVALPLSMAIAIASGLPPQAGLFTAIVGGFLISALGGSRYQVGGPAGAFIVLVAATVSRHGVDGMLLATMMAGVMMMLIGWLRIGSYIKFIPYPVTIGFTAGIAVIILTSQLRDLFGLTLAGPEPGPFADKIAALWAAAPSASPAAFGVAAAAVVVILAVQRWRPRWPAMLVAMVVATLAAVLLGLDVETIGSRFGGIPRSLPLPTLPEISVERMLALLPDAVAFALLGSIESLLSAVVADGMTGRRHRSNCELVAQGIGNIGAALFGGMTATGTIARTATNIRAGAHGPVAGMLHAVFLLAFMMVAAPLAAYVPLAALAGLLAVVAWNMFDRAAFVALLRGSRGDAVVLLATFLLVVFRDLTEGIVVGFLLGSVLFIDRMSKSLSVETGTMSPESDVADRPDGADEALPAAVVGDPDVAVYRLSGALFFGAAATMGGVLDRIGGRHRALVLDMAGISMVDSSAANVIELAARRATAAGTRVYIAGASLQARRALLAQGVRPPLVHYEADAEAALRQAHADLADAG